MIKQGRFSFGLMSIANPHIRIRIAPCFHFTAILKSMFLVGVSMALRGGKQGGFASRLCPLVDF